MRAVMITRFGRAEDVAEVVDVPAPGAPGPGQVLLNILAAPINPSDFLVFQGRFGASPPSLPAKAGGEAVGEVVAVGPGVDNLQPGDRILALHAGRGNWRQQVLADAGRAVALPADVDPLQLAMLAVNPATALHMLTRFMTLQPGEWVLQNAGTSAVAHCVMRLAKARGIRTINLVRQEAHIGMLLDAGADVVLVDGMDLAGRVSAATGGADIRLGLDAVAGDATGRLASCITPGGTVVIYGLLSAPSVTLPAADLVFRDVTLRGYWFTPWFDRASKAELAETYETLIADVRSGALRVPVAATYPMEQIREALAHAAQPGRQGKVLLLPNEGTKR